jgi:hypothetical protein
MYPRPSITTIYTDAIAMMVPVPAANLAPSLVPVQETVDDTGQSQGYAEKIREPYLWVRDSKHEQTPLVNPNDSAATGEPAGLQVPYRNIKKKANDLHTNELDTCCERDIRVYLIMVGYFPI